MGNFADRLKQAMDGPPKIKQVELAAACGIKPPSISDWLNGRSVNIEGKNLLAAAKLLNVRPEWLSKGTGQMRPSASENKKQQAGRTRVPILGVAQLGADGYWCDMDYPIGFGDGWVEVPTNDAGAYALKVKGDSMSPAIRPDWIVVMEPDEEVHPGELVLVCTTDGMRMVKEYLFDRGSSITLGSINQDHKPVTLDRADIVRMHHVGYIVPPSKRRE